MRDDVCMFLIARLLRWKGDYYCWCCAAACVLEQQLCGLSSCIYVYFICYFLIDVPWFHSLLPPCCVEDSYLCYHFINFSSSCWCDFSLLSFPSRDTLRVLLLFSACCLSYCSLAQLLREYVVFCQCRRRQDRCSVNPLIQYHQSTVLLCMFPILPCILIRFSFFLLILHGTRLPFFFAQFSVPPFGFLHFVVSCQRVLCYLSLPLFPFLLSSAPTFS